MTALGVARMSEHHGNALPAGHILGRYTIRSVLGAGGFGITYKASYDEPGASGGGEFVAIKEYLPSGISVRGGDGVEVHPISQEERESFFYGLERFRREAQTLARFNHPSIVSVQGFFEANGTAYMVMGYERGESLAGILERYKRLEQSELEEILDPLLDGLETVHRANVFHRDIKPDNIFIRIDGSPVLLDFGAARQDLGERSHSVKVVVSPPFAPVEQYSSDGNIGPWTDVYALAVTLYVAATGQMPAEATKRGHAALRGAPDPMVPIERLAGSRFTPDFVAAVARGMLLREDVRPRSVGEWRATFKGAVASPGVAPAVAAEKAASGVGDTPASQAKPAPGSAEVLAERAEAPGAGDAPKPSEGDGAKDQAARAKPIVSAKPDAAPAPGMSPPTGAAEADSTVQEAKPATASSDAEEAVGRDTDAVDQGTPEPPAARKADARPARSSGTRAPVSENVEAKPPASEPAPSPSRAPEPAPVPLDSKRGGSALPVAKKAAQAQMALPIGERPAPVSDAPAVPPPHLAPPATGSGARWIKPAGIAAVALVSLALLVAAGIALWNAGSESDPGSRRNATAPRDAGTVDASASAAAEAERKAREAQEARNAQAAREAEEAKEAKERAARERAVQIEALKQERQRIETLEGDARFAAEKDYYAKLYGLRGDEADRLYKEANELHGNREFRDAYRKYLAAAELGHLDSQVNLGFYFTVGHGVKRDEDQAALWFRRAAERGHRVAQSNLAGLYTSGRGVNRNHAQALDWARRAADQGYPAAYGRLGYLYRHGLGVDQDYKTSMEWYRKAANKGHAWSMAEIGNLHENGLGVERDIQKAANWYKLAASRGNTYAKERLKALGF